MYQSAYSDVMTVSGSAGRRREREALDRALNLLNEARATGLRSACGAEAVFFTNRVWSYLIEDLSLSENELPEGVRADLISIGFFIIRRLEAVRVGDTTALDDVVEVMSLIRDGLE